MAGATKAAIGKKPVVIEHIYRSRLDPTTNTLADPVIDSDAVVGAIQHCAKAYGIKLSTKNPANFLKDYLRSPHRNALWPASLKAARVTARQKYRNGRVFAFVPYAPDQTEPFPDPFRLAAAAPEQAIEAVSLPSDARALGRNDEAWLIQVCVHQRVVQAHFAIYSPLDVIDLFHLQNSIKATPEVDAVFLVTYRHGAQIKKALATLEAKRNEPILGDQIRAQVAFMASQCTSRPALQGVETIVPIAARSETRNGMRVVALFEMQPITVADGSHAYDIEEEHNLPLNIVGGVAYRFIPTVSGI